MDALRLIVIGGGEHARVVAEAALSGGRYRLEGFVDPAPCVDTETRLGLRRLGGDDVLEQYRGALVVLGVGSVGVGEGRRRVVERVGASVSGWATVVHAGASVSPTATLAEGAVVMAGATVNSGARIGRHCVVNTGSIVEHDVVLGDFAQVAPGAVIGGGTVIGSDAFVGLGAVVRDHIRVGAHAFIGMGTVIIEDVPDNGHMRTAGAVDRRDRMTH
jgi:acetyltransferase EpsM